MEGLRKKAFIDARTAGALRDSPAHNIGQSHTENENSEARGTVPVPRQHTKDLETDLETVTQFLMAGGAEEIQDDSDVWKILQAQVRAFAHLLPSKSLILYSNPVVRNKIGRRSGKSTAQKSRRKSKREQLSMPR